MSEKVTTRNNMTQHGAGVETTHYLANDVLRIGVLSGLDGRIASIVHVPTSRELLAQYPPFPHNRSAFPYGVSIWVKSGELIDGYGHVLLKHLLPADYLLSQRPQLADASEGITYTAVHEAAGIRLEKCCFLPNHGSVFRVDIRLTNCTNTPLRLQLEHILAWDTGFAHPGQTFVIPSLNGIDLFRTPPYEAAEIDRRVLAEPWGAILDGQQQAGLIVTFSGITRLNRLLFGTHGMFGIYSPITELAPMGMIETSQTFHYLPSLVADEVPAAIAPIRARLLTLTSPSGTPPCAGVRTRDRWDALLPRPRKAVRRPGACRVSLTSVIAPAELAEEARLFQQQGAKAFLPCSGGVPIYLVQAPEDSAPEAYQLEMTPNAVTITGRPHGVLHGCQTLLDLLMPEQDGLYAPCGCINDAPDLALRGMLMFPDGPDWDVRLEAFSQHVLARLKLNTLAFFVNPHLIQFTEPPAGMPTENPAGIPASRLRKVIALIRAMHIEVIPLYSITPSTDFADEATVQNDAILERIIEIFQPRRINIGLHNLRGRYTRLASQETLNWLGTEGSLQTAGYLRIHPDDPDHVAFVKLVHRYYHFLHDRGVEMGIWTDLLQHEQMDATPLLTDPRWALEQLPRDLVLQDRASCPVSPASVYIAAGFPRIISSPMTMPQTIRAYAQALADQGGLGLLPTSWGEGPSPDRIGHLEGLIWSSTYGWRVDEPEIDEVRVLMQERIAWILSRRWE
jgi:hypothetical protein